MTDCAQGKPTCCFSQPQFTVHRNHLQGGLRMRVLVQSVHAQESVSLMVYDACVHQRVASSSRTTSEQQSTVWIGALDPYCTFIYTTLNTVLGLKPQWGRPPLKLALQMYSSPSRLSVSSLKATPLLSDIPSLSTPSFIMLLNCSKSTLPSCNREEGRGRGGGRGR